LNHALHHTMISWKAIVYVGNVSVMLPAAAAIAVWLVAGRLWKMALLWSLLFTVGLGLVAASKTYFIGWGTGFRSLDFKALSGHAMLTTAVFPVMIYLLLQRFAPVVLTCGTLFGLLFVGLVGICLVVLDFHSIAEVVGGCAIGGVVSLSFIRIYGTLPTLRLNRLQLPCSLLVFMVVSYAKPAAMEHWTTGVALRLSGHDRPYSLRLGN